MARTCGILKLNTAVEAYINAIINITNINDNREIKNAELIENLITFIRVNGQYIRTGWTIILETISKIDYYLNTDKESIRDDLRHKPSMKNIEKENNNTNKIKRNNKKYFNKKTNKYKRR